MFNILGSQQAA